MKSEEPRGVIHVALFTPKANLTGAERDALMAALDDALGGIPLIRRARVARRIRLGRLYDETSPPYEYLVLLEFDSEDDLRAYLDHPAHEALGRHFYESSEAAAAWDFREDSDRGGGITIGQWDRDRGAGSGITVGQRDRDREAG